MVPFLCYICDLSGLILIFGFGLVIELVLYLGGIC